MIYPILLCLSIASGCIASLYFEACLLVALLWSLVLPVLAMGFAVLFLEKPPWLIRGTNGALNMQIVGFAAKMYNGKITDPLHDYGLNFRTVEISRDISNLHDLLGAMYGAWPASEGVQHAKEGSSPKLRGWHVPAQSGPSGTSGNKTNGCIVCLHGGGRDRRAFMRHLPSLVKSSYSVLLVDCSSHGLSDVTGRGLSYGIRESYDCINIVRYARRTLKYTNVVLLGTSQGASSSIIAAATLAHAKTLRDVNTANTANTASTASPVNTTSTMEARATDAQSGYHPCVSDFVVNGLIAENPFACRLVLMKDILISQMGAIPWFLGGIMLNPLRDMYVNLIVYLIDTKLIRSLSLPSPSLSTQSALSASTSASASASASASVPASIARTIAQCHVSSLLARAPSPQDVAHLLDCPLFLMHGAKDGLVSPNHSETLLQRINTRTRKDEQKSGSKCSNGGKNKTFAARHRGGLKQRVCRGKLGAHSTRSRGCSDGEADRGGDVYAHAARTASDENACMVEYWLAPEARHTELYDVHTEDWEERVLSFISRCA